MRPLLTSDLMAAARALLAVPEMARPAHCARLLAEADWADRYTRRLGRVHPLWGDGTLLAAASSHRLASDPGFDDPEYRGCLSLLLDALASRGEHVTCNWWQSSHIE